MSIRMRWGATYDQDHLVVWADGGGGGHSVDNLPADILVDGEPGVHGHHGVEINTSFYDLCRCALLSSDAQGEMRNYEKIISQNMCAATRTCSEDCRC